MGCYGDECALGGEGFCNLQDKVCYELSDLPCIQCVSDWTSRSSSRSFSRSSATSRSTITGMSSSAVFSAPFPYCMGTECAFGGDSFCALQNLSCANIPELPCIQCLPLSFSLSSLSENGSSSPHLVIEDLVLCTDDQDCPEGLHCTDGTCHYPCLSDIDCRPKERCIDRFCRPLIEIAELPTYCGNARVDPGEQCDDGMRNSDLPNSICRPDCTFGRCGDGILDTPLELCDDGNISANDGCSPSCQLERAAPSPTQTLPATVIELPFAPPSSSSRAPSALVCAVKEDCPAGYACENGFCISRATVVSSHAPPQTTDTGPATIAIMAAGAAAGWAWTRRKHARG